MFFSDLALSNRLETANAVSNVKLANEYANAFPNSGTETLAIAGGYAIYLGDNSPMTQALGMGLEQPISTNEIEKIENFYFQKNSAVNIELSPYVDLALLELLAKREYHLTEVSNVLVKHLDKNNLAAPANSEIEIISVKEHNTEILANTLIKGFGVEGKLADLLKKVWELGIKIPENLSFLAKIHNNFVGGGGMFIYEGIASFSGASTLPEFRKLGVQTKLLQHRLSLAATLGCDLAMISTLPGTTSQHNAEKQGFRIVYTRIKLMRQVEADPRVCPSCL